MSKGILSTVLTGIGVVLTTGGLTDFKYREYKKSLYKLIDNDGNVIIEGSPGRVISYIDENNLTDADGIIETSYETVKTNNTGTGKVLICIGGICLLTAGIIAFRNRKKKKSDKR